MPRTVGVEAVLKKIITRQIIDALDNLYRSGNYRAENFDGLSLTGSSSLFISVPGFYRVPEDIDFSVIMPIEAAREDGIYTPARLAIGALCKDTAASIGATFYGDVLYIDWSSNNLKVAIAKKFSMEEIGEILKTPEQYGLSEAEISQLKNINTEVESKTHLHFRAPKHLEMAILPEKPYGGKAGGLMIRDIRDTAAVKIELLADQRESKNIADVYFLNQQGLLNPDDEMFQWSLAFHITEVFYERDFMKKPYWQYRYSFYDSEAAGVFASSTERMQEEKRNVEFGIVPKMFSNIFELVKKAVGVETVVEEVVTKSFEGKADHWSKDSEKWVHKEAVRSDGKVSLHHIGIRPEFLSKVDELVEQAKNFDENMHPDLEYAALRDYFRTEVLPKLQRPSRAEAILQERQSGARELGGKRTIPEPKKGSWSDEV